MEDYFRLVSDELLNKLNQVRQFIKRHNPTIGILTEEILRNFLKIYLPKSVSVEQGFIMSVNGQLSKQCDILIYDSFHFAPFYRLNDIVIVPTEAVVAIIEVKTTITKQIFHEVIEYFKNIRLISSAKSYLFIYNSSEITKIENYFLTYKHKGEYQKFDHDTFQFLPDEITGINNSYHLKKDAVVFERDMIGYSSFFYENEQGTEINALENFYLSIYGVVENHNSAQNNVSNTSRQAYFNKRNLKNYFAIELFAK